MTSLVGKLARPEGTPVTSLLQPLQSYMMSTDVSVAYSTASKSQINIICTHVRSPVFAAEFPQFSLPPTRGAKRQHATEAWLRQRRA